MVTTHLHSYFIWDCFNSQRATKETFKTGKKYIYILGFFLFFFGARSRGAGDGAPLGPLQKGKKKRRILGLGHAHSEARSGESLIRNSPCINAQESSNPINS